MQHLCGCFVVLTPAELLLQTAETMSCYMTLGFSVSETSRECQEGGGLQSWLHTVLLLIM